MERLWGSITSIPSLRRIHKDWFKIRGRTPIRYLQQVDSSYFQSESKEERDSSGRWSYEELMLWRTRGSLKKTRKYLIRSLQSSQEDPTTSRIEGVNNYRSFRALVTSRNMIYKLFFSFSLWIWIIDLFVVCLNDDMILCIDDGWRIMNENEHSGCSLF